MNGQQFFADLERIDRSKVLCVLDLLTSLTSIPADEVHARDGAIAQLRTEVEAQRHKDAKFDFSTFAEVLPAAETASNQPSFHGAGDGYYLSDNGYSTKQMDDPAKWTVRFTNGLGTRGTVEELVFASAASLARKKGYAGFVVVSRQTVDRTTHVTSYYGPSYDENSGREAQLVVWLVYPGQFPDDLKGAESRYLAADKVLADFAIPTRA